MICENTKVDVVAMVPGTVISGMNEGPPTAMVSPDFASQLLFILSDTFLTLFLISDANIGNMGEKGNWLSCSRILLFKAVTNHNPTQPTCMG